MYQSAFALEYDPEEGCEIPVVCARGSYFQADQIVALARKHGVPVVERPELAAALQVIEEGNSIPRKLFRAVAALIAELSVGK